MKNNVDNFLAHVGVLGMHWGHHKSRSSSSSSRKDKPKRESSEDHKKKLDLRKKKMHEMTNVELKQLNERLNLERQYKDLTKAEISSGHKFANELLVGVAKQTLSNYLSRGIAKGVEIGVHKVKHK